MARLANFFKKIRVLSHTQLIIAVSVFMIVFDNTVFFQQVIEVYPISFQNMGFLCSLALFLACLYALLLTLFTISITTKPVLIINLLLSSVVGYFMYSYGTVIDSSMIQNMIQTDMHEALDLISLELPLFIIVLGVLPAVAVYHVKLTPRSVKSAAWSKIKLILGAFAIITVVLFMFNRFYTSFFREHKALRYYVNPLHSIYASVKYIGQFTDGTEHELRPLGVDAIIPASDIDRELIILVVGEAARANRFSLNGYDRKTNPELENESVISFTNMHSCGTSTAVSVPCMFSIYGHDDYSKKKANSTQNLLDVLSYAGVNILWRDNNSSSKGVALNIEYEDFRSPEINTICDVECRDEGMLVGLQEYIDDHEEGDILIILHQMGNHGPAYYKRYPDRFEVFTPVCKTNMLQECTQEEIGNAYDNAILYTDYFLSRVIQLLKKNANKFEPAMIYFSDHGESLGGNGIYLHGMPYFMAPEEQKHIPAIMWFGESFQIDITELQERADEEFSHDNLFHTLLGLMEIETSIYNPELDIINQSH